MGIVSKNSSDNKLHNLLNKIDNPQKQQNKAAYDHCVKADALRIQNYFWESIDEYLSAISCDESNYEAYKGLALSYKQVGYIKSAIESFEKAKKLAPFDKAIRYELGYCYYQANKLPKSMKELQKAIKLDPEYIDAQFQLAVVHELINELDLAIKIYQKIIKERPSFIAAYNNLASLYIRIGLLDKAISIFKELLIINPDFVRAYLGIAVAYDKMNNTNDAVRFYRKYMEIKPNSVNIPYIVERLSELKKESKPSSKTHLKLVICNK